ncbi:SDR family NAD(P)-dependent oxidoreductase [Lentisphaerota bacterium ZTH]|nr:SDR family NAD(P)-dependent oxidoreductase [Lentisphaerota bacterium]WET05864.1 SDR family NAD(P)-dependent oxidoreductase [Lentisphaerota bacterium ZTH]
MEKIAVITGVSSGLGMQEADLFRKSGFKVVGVSRSRPNVGIDHWIQADITVPEERGKIIDYVENECGRIDLLINNAGRGSYALWEELNEDELRSLFELNFFALVDLTMKFLPMLKETKGTIINVSSVLGKMHVACMGGYCCSKYAVVAFSDSLRPEVKKYGVNVINIMPGRIDTGFSHNCVGARKPPPTPMVNATPRGLAKAMYKAYRRGSRQKFYPWLYGPFVSLVRIIPDFVDNINRKAWKID